MYLYYMCIHIYQLSMSTSRGIPEAAGKQVKIMDVPQGPLDENVPTGKPASVIKSGARSQTGLSMHWPSNHAPCDRKFSYPIFGAIV